MTLGEPLRYEAINTAVSGPGEHFARYDALREKGNVHPATVNGRNPYLLVSGMAEIRACLQDPATFSSSAVTVDDPNPPYMWIPEMVDPPLHTKWRHLLGRTSGSSSPSAGHTRGKTSSVSR
jgi:cytochrome P450